MSRAMSCEVYIDQALLSLAAARAALNEARDQVMPEGDEQDTFFAGVDAAVASAQSNIDAAIVAYIPAAAAYEAYMKLADSGAFEAAAKAAADPDGAP